MVDKKCQNKDCKIKSKQPLSGFNKNKRQKDGYDHYCKSCRKIYNDGRYKYYNDKYDIPCDIIVYGWTDYRGELVYIGKTKMGGQRIDEHYKHRDKSAFIPKGLDPNDYKYHVLWYGDCEKDMKCVEDELIDLHRPKLNKAGNKDYILDMIEDIISSGCQTSDLIRIKEITSKL